MPEIQFNLTENSKLKVEITENEELYYYGVDVMPNDDQKGLKWEHYGTDLHQLIEVHGMSRNAIATVFETRAWMDRVISWLHNELSIDELEFTEAELDCEKEVQSWMHN